MGYVRGIPITEISVLVFTTWLIMKFQTGSSTQLSRSNLFRPYFTEKDIIREVNGRKFESIEM